MPNTFSASRVQELIHSSADVKQQLAQQCASDILTCGELLAQTASQRRLIMLCGNGGSAADSQHIAAELVVRLRGNVNRRAIAAMALTVDPSVMTAGGNDFGFEEVFKRQVEAFGTNGDALIAISTSGTSKNVVRAVEYANTLGMTTIGLLGGSGGTLKGMCTSSVVVPSEITARIQECHILIGHIWCEMIEESLFPELF